MQLRSPLLLIFRHTHAPGLCNQSDGRQVRGASGVSLLDMRSFLPVHVYRDGHHGIPEVPGIDQFCHHGLHLAVQQHGRQPAAGDPVPCLLQLAGGFFSCRADVDRFVSKILPDAVFRLVTDHAKLFGRVQGPDLFVTAPDYFD